MKLIAINLLLAIAMLLNALGFNGQQRPFTPEMASAGTAAASSPTTGSTSSPTPQPGYGAYPPPGITTPAPTSTPTPVTTSTPTPAPTVTPTPTIPPIQPSHPDKSNFELKISAEPAIFLPGKPIRLHINVEGFVKNDSSANMQVVLHIPDGVTASDPSVASAITPDGLLQMDPDSVGKSISWDVSPTANPPFAFSVTLVDNGTVFEQNAVVVDAGSFEIGSEDNIGGLG